MIKDTGGQAFASGSVQKSRARPGDPGSDWIEAVRSEPIYKGMTLRDYCAIKAMEAIIGKCGDYDPLTTGKTQASVSKLAYEFSDAMLEARKS
jgi:hypothetical protein